VVRVIDESIAGTVLINKDKIISIEYYPNNKCRINMIDDYYYLVDHLLIFDTL
jgi:hypothetical protein